MKKLLLTTAIVMAMGSSTAFAHHPAADIVDPEIYEMIDENVSDVHAAMTFDDMGGDTTDVGSAAEARNNDVGNAGAAPGGDLEDVGAEMSGELEDVGAAMESREEANSMADTEPSGPMTAQR
jgi:hypothetical protein